MAEKVTALVPTFNEESNIEACLESIRWADEILVVDSFSTDKTVDIARRYTDHVLEHEYVNSATQKNWTIPQVEHPWVLVVDADVPAQRFWCPIRTRRGQRPLRRASMVVSWRPARYTVRSAMYTRLVRSERR